LIFLFGRKYHIAFFSAIVNKKKWPQRVNREEQYQDDVGAILKTRKKCYVLFDWSNFAGFRD